MRAQCERIGYLYSISYISIHHTYIQYIAIDITIYRNVHSIDKQNELTSFEELISVSILIRIGINKCIFQYKYAYIQNKLSLGLALSDMFSWPLIATSRNDLLDRTDLETGRRLINRSKTPRPVRSRGKEEALRVSLI